MRWLLTQGHQVYGVELAEDAVRGYFEDAGERFDVISGRYAYLDSYVGPGGVIYRGNLFDLTAPDLPGIQAVYDRAALVALPLDLRARYADHLLRIVPDGTRILLVTMEFEQSRVAGPPFAVPSDEVEMLFKDRCRVERLDSGNVYDPPPKFAVAGVEDAQEVVWRITKQH